MTLSIRWLLTRGKPDAFCTAKWILRILETFGRDDQSRKINIMSIGEALQVGKAFLTELKAIHVKTLRIIQMAPLVVFPKQALPVHALQSCRMNSMTEPFTKWEWVETIYVPKGGEMNPSGRSWSNIWLAPVFSWYGVENAGINPLLSGIRQLAMLTPDCPAAFGFTLKVWAKNLGCRRPNTSGYSEHFIT